MDRLKGKLCTTTQGINCLGTSIGCCVIFRRYFLGASPIPDRGTGGRWPIPAFARTSLSRCAWESLKVFLQEAVPENDPIPGAVIAMQTFGDFLGYNPHTHILVTDGCYLRQAQDGVCGNKGMFRVSPPLELKKLEAI
ncbi:MAG: transposase, partial [Syntrophales bacterium]|nr:transposase [Syntrophales bacterium]